jgi:hypothetical protein
VLRRTRGLLLIVWVTIALALIAGVFDLARGVREQARVVDRNAAADAAGRNAGGAMSIDIDRGFVAAALAFVAQHGTYAIETGPAAEVSTPLTTRFLPTFLQGRLLPARLVSPGRARWLLCYGCDPAAWPEFEPVYGESPYFIERRQR